MKTFSKSAIPCGMRQAHSAATPNRPGIRETGAFWDRSPVCAWAVPYPPGSAEYFACYDALREKNESPEFSLRFHEYRAYAGKKVLDIGCGNGYVLSRYAQHGATVYGVDISQRAVQICRSRFNLLGITGVFQQANAHELPFDDGTFDCACSMGVLHHVPEPRRAVAEIRRVLKPGGTFMLMVYHRNSALYRIMFPIRSIIEKKPVYQLVNEVDGTGNPKGDVYSKAELRKLLRQFEQVRMFAGLLQGYMVAPKFGRCIPDRLLRPFEGLCGWFLYAKCRKQNN